MSVDVDKVRNFIQVSERLASSGQPEKHEFEAIAQAGYQVVINLAMADSVHAIPEEGNIVAARGMVYVHVPVPFDAPDVAHLRNFLRVMAAFPDQNLWVHCALNYRVSAFLYHYQRLVHGATRQEAQKAMLASWEPDPIWRRFMSITDKELGF